MQDFWQKQDHSHPLYPDLIWSRPENKHQAGKLLIAGGNAQSFAAVNQAFSVAQQAGIESIRVILPDVLQKSLSSIFVGAVYAPSTPSGSLSRQALGLILDNAAWADALLLSGDFGRNSETAILLESLLRSYQGRLCLTKDVIDYFNHLPLKLLDRADTMIVLSLSQLQKLNTATKSTQAISLSMDLVRLVEFLHQFTKTHQSLIITKHLNYLLVAFKGQVITTKESDDRAIWRVATAAKAVVWWAQNKPQILAAAATSFVA